MPQLTFDLFFDQSFLAIFFYVVLYYYIGFFVITMLVQYLLIIQNTGIRFLQFFNCLFLIGVL